VGRVNMGVFRVVGLEQVEILEAAYVEEKMIFLAVWRPNRCVIVSCTIGQSGRLAARSRNQEELSHNGERNAALVRRQGVLRNSWLKFSICSLFSLSST